MLKIKDIEKYIDDPLLDSIFREREEELYIECKNEDEDIIEIKQNYDIDCEKLINKIKKFDFKFKAVKYVVYGKHSYREAARKFNVHQEQIRVWTNRYKTYGKNGLIPKPIQKYDGKFKVDVVEYMYANHLSFEKTAIHFGLPSSTNVVLWKQMYDEKGARVFA